MIGGGKTRPARPRHELRHGLEIIGLLDRGLELVIAALKPELLAVLHGVEQRIVEILNRLRGGVGVGGMALTHHQRCKQQHHNHRNCPEQRVFHRSASLSMRI
ncbi:MAG: hypothetical protein WDM89_05670 [Rhizomicrobium sp.]